MGYSIFDETMVDMAWPKIEQAAQEGAIVLLPTGVIEEHGPHMGLGVDIYCAYLLSKLTRRELEKKGISTLIAPPNFWGINNATGAFPGSFSLRKKTLKALIYDILASIRRWGVTYVFNINWHGDGGHNGVILDAVQEARGDTGIRAYCVLREFDLKRFGLSGREGHVIVKREPDPGPPPAYMEIHAEAGETAIMQEYFPSQVDAEMAKGLKPTNLTLKDLFVWREGWSDARNMTPQGYFGSPAEADSVDATKLMETDARMTADLIASFLKGEYTYP